MTDSNPSNDPLIAHFLNSKKLKQKEIKATVVVPYMVRKYEVDGYKTLRIAFGKQFRWGRTCVWTGKVSDGSIQECVLMIK